MAQIKYVRMTYYVNGEMFPVFFEVQGEEAAVEEEIVAEEEHVSHAKIEKGDRGEDVQALQEILIEKGYLEGEADGIFGSQTKEAVQALQEALGLEQTGVADDALFANLDE